ncbi:FAD-dependent oxidoreductase [Actinocatenispora comari]|nr:FAD-dependent monooxygenase [Actinocatenispora comari]
MAGTKCAVVIGASIAGLLTARALSEKFEQVIVLEHDSLPTTPVSRKKVPQSRQLHVLLAKGAQVLDELFPGFTDDLVAAGAVRSDPQVDTTYCLDGHPLASAPSGITTLGISRPYVEYEIRRRASELPNVEIRDNVEVTGIVLGDDHSTITGVNLLNGSVSADLVVDAGGRYSQALKWLNELGVPMPSCSQVDPGVVYVTRHYQRERHHLDGRNGMLVVPYPECPRGAGIVPVEGNRWAVVLFGLFDVDPGTTDSSMSKFAESLPTPAVAKLIRDAEPVDDAVRMRYPSSRWWHLERQRRHLHGLLVVGDALCSFNPTYGQGISVAAMEAMTLRDLITGDAERLPAKFYQAAAKIINIAWSLSAGGDMRFSQIKGKRTTSGKVINSYLNRYRLAAGTDPILGKAFLETANMLAPAAKLLTPAKIARTLRGSRRATRIAE